MSTFARITDGVAVEIWTDGGLGIAPADVFVSGLAEQFEPVPVEVKAGWSLIYGIWTAPPFAPEPAPPVQTVTMRQCRIALLDAGLLDAVQSSIVTMPGTEGERARIDWEYALEVRRDWPLISYMAGDLGLTDEQVDALFMAAASI